MVVFCEPVTSRSNWQFQKDTVSMVPSSHVAISCVMKQEKYMCLEERRELVSSSLIFSKTMLDVSFSEDIDSR